MLKPEFTGQFKKDYKLAVKRGCDPQKAECCRGIAVRGEDFAACLPRSCAD